MTSSALAGAWTRDAGDLLLVTTGVYYSSDRYFDQDGQTKPQGEFSKYELNPYLEYGLTDSLTLGANFFAQYLEQEAITGESNDNWGLTDTELFARQRLLQGESWVVSFQPLIKLPSFYYHDELPKGGNNRFDLEASLLGGYSFSLWSLYHYADIRFGYRHRLDYRLHDQLRMDAKLGLSLSDRWQLIPALAYTHALGNTQSSAFAESGLNDYDLLKVECSLLYRWNEQLYLSAGLFSHMDGTQTGKGHGMMVSTGYQF